MTRLPLIGPECMWCGHWLEPLPTPTRALYCPVCEPSAPYLNTFDCDDDAYQVRTTDYPLEDET